MGKRRIPQISGGMPQGIHAALVADSLDLHGVRADDAEQRVAWFLERARVQHPGEVVRIITGRGTGSAGAPALQPAVREALNGPLKRHIREWAVDVGGGAFLVRVKK